MLAELEEGSIVRINENGSPAEFYVAKHDYESELNGTGRTLVVRKSCYEERKWDNSNVNAYAYSDIDTWLNSTYITTLDTIVRENLGPTKIKYTLGNGNTTVGTLVRAVFLLSMTELGVSSNSTFGINTEGSSLSIAPKLRVVYLNSSVTSQWSRTPNYRERKTAFIINADGSSIDDIACTNTSGVRPAFTLLSTTMADETGAII